MVHNILIARMLTFLFRDDRAREVRSIFVFVFREDLHLVFLSFHNYVVVDQFRGEG